MLSGIKRKIQNLPGWHTERKIIVFHSDDWGSIRIPDRHAYNRLVKSNPFQSRIPYNRFDRIASKQDLEALFETLRGIKDTYGNSAVFTANCVLANPDFKRIRESDFEKYHYEELNKTFKKYNNIDALELWKVGYEEGVFMPQYHGREHLNVIFWLDKLKGKHKDVLQAFDYEVFGVEFQNLGLKKSNFQAAWDFHSKEQEQEINSIIAEGIKLFEKRFNYTPKTAIAPSYTWNQNQESILWAMGVKQMQGIPIQKVPRINKRNYKRRLRYTTTHSSKPGYQMRNVFFEPAFFPNMDTTDEVLKRIDIAFKMHKPAIISTHRVNYIGYYDESNRSNTLKLLGHILNRAIKEWPDLEFMNAEQLCCTILNKGE